MTIKSMTSDRKTALIAGVLYLVTFVTSIPALAMKAPLLDHTDFILGRGSATSVTWAAILDALCAIANVGTGVVLYRVAKRHSGSLALGFVMSRLMEAAIMMIGVISLLSVVTLRHDMAGATGADSAMLVATGRTLTAIHDWTFLLGPGVIPAINALLIGTVMYKARLLPRWIPTLGLIGAPLLLGASTAAIFGSIEQVSTVSMLLTLPIAVWEFSFGMRMAVKGFLPVPTTGPITESSTTEAQFAVVA